MKYYSIISIALVLVLLGPTGAVMANATDSKAHNTDTWTPPAALEAFLATHPGDQGCISGSVLPFTIEDTNCSDTSGAQVQSYSLDCSSTTNHCQAGDYNSPANNDYHWEAWATVPSNPSNTYYNPTTASNWIGLQSCEVSCSGTVYLLQAGIYYGWNSTSNSKHPVMFEEFIQSGSGACSPTSAFCGDAKVPVSVSDSVFFSINYDSGFQYWTLYSQDSTSNKYDLYYEYYGTGSGQIPLTSMAYSSAVAEGGGITSSSGFPGSFDFYYEIGLYGSHQGQLGPYTLIHYPSGSAPAATIAYNTYTCPTGYPGTTCGDTDVSWG